MATTAAADVPKLKLNNGFEVPMFGLGTWKDKPAESVKDAIDAGYRHIDTAFIYDNEPKVGEAIKEKIAEGVVSREELFIVSKLWSTYHRADLVIPSLKKSLTDLGLEYLDLYLIHTPVALKEGGETNFSFDGKWEFSDADYVDTWKEMEKAVGLGLVRSIGLSNFNKDQINRILSMATIKPVMNQVECHPFLSQEKLVAFCKSKDIAITAYSPLGSPSSPFLKEGSPNVIGEPRLTEIGKKYGKSPVHVALRWQIQRGIIVIPRSTKTSRIVDNINIFDFTLDAEDMAKIGEMNTNTRLYGEEVWKESKYFPFNTEY